MGQQQLLLVILVTIVVGIATVASTNIFGNSAVQANHDAVRQDLAQMATSAQSWYMKPKSLGGGQNRFRSITFRNIAFPAATISDNGRNATNLNGSYRLVMISNNQFSIEGRPASNAEDNNQVYVATITSGEFTISLSEPLRPIRPTRPNR